MQHCKLHPATHVPYFPRIITSDQLKPSSSKAYAPEDDPAPFSLTNTHSFILPCNNYNKSSLALRCIHSGLVVFRKVPVLLKLHLLAVF